MFYKFKKGLMQRLLDYKKRKEPFRPEDWEEFQIKPTDPHEINNSYFLGAHTSAGDDLTMRLGQRNGSEHELFVIYRVGQTGQVLQMERDHYPAAEVPLQVTCERVGWDFRYRFDGYLMEQLSGERHRVEFDVLFQGRLPIYDFVCSAQKNEGMTCSIAREHWDKQLFRDLADSSQKHYEQTGWLTGWIRVDGEERPIDWPATRDRAMGKRIWDRMSCHLWICGVTDKGEGVLVSFVNYPHIRGLFTGYTNIGRRENVTLTDIRVMHYDHADGQGSPRAKFYTRWSDGRSMVFESQRDTNVRCTFDDGDYYFQEGLGNFLVNGAPARGNIEYGFNKNPQRWGAYETI